MKQVYKSLYPTFKFLQEPINLEEEQGPTYLLFVSQWNDKFLDDLQDVDYLSPVGPPWPDGLTKEDLTEVYIVDSWNWPEYFGMDMPFQVTQTPTLVRVEGGKIFKVDYPPLISQVLFEAV